MRGSMRIALAAAVILAACAKSSGAPTVTAPVSNCTTAAATATVTATPTPTQIPTGTESVTSSPEPTTPSARFRACAVDADCIAVDRVGCCHNGWKEAVAVTQKDAYAASFTCPDPHPICAMYIVRDMRQPRCDAATHLCTLVPPAQTQ